MDTTEMTNLLEEIRALLLTANSTNDTSIKSDKISECIKLIDERFKVKGGFTKKVIELIDGVLIIRYEWNGDIDK